MHRTVSTITTSLKMFPAKYQRRKKVIGHYGYYLYCYYFYIYIKYFHYLEKEYTWIQNFAVKLKYYLWGEQCLDYFWTPTTPLPSLGTFCGLPKVLSTAITLPYHCIAVRSTITPLIQLCNKYLTLGVHSHIKKGSATCES